MGGLEIPLTISVEILEINLKHFNDINCNILHDKNINLIKEIIFDFNEFLHKVTKGKYSDLELISQYIPHIIMNLFIVI